MTAKELAMATQLVEAMATRWNPGDYHNEFREHLSDLVRKRIKQKGTTTTVLDEHEEPGVEASISVVDFDALLQTRLGEKGSKATKATGKTPAKQGASKQAVSKPRKFV
ncbi:MAG: hypothetical protein ACMG50_00210 [Thermomonas sp.]